MVSEEIKDIEEMVELTTKLWSLSNQLFGYNLNLQEIMKDAFENKIDEEKMNGSIAEIIKKKENNIDLSIGIYNKIKKSKLYGEMKWMHRCYENFERIMKNFAEIKNSIYSPRA